MSSPDQHDPRRWRALWVCLVAGFMTLLDVSIVNVALPAMQRGVGASSAELSWVVSGYALTFGLVLVSAGRLGDDRGRAKVFLVALALFTLTSAAAGLAQNPTWLVVTRLLQGAAGGMLFPQVVGVIQQLFTGRERGTAFGFFGAAIGLSTAIGPLAGGLLLQWGGEAEGWRWVFYVNVPIGVVALLLGLRWLPRNDTGDTGDTADTTHTAGTVRRPLDIVGAVLLGLAVVSLMYPLVVSEGSPSTAPWWLLAVAVGLLVVFVVWERGAGRRHGHPLVNFGLLRTRSYALGTLLGLLYFAGFTAIFFVTTLFFQQGRGYTPLEAGLALTPFAVGSAVSSWLSGGLVARYGKPLIVVGLVMVAAGLVAVDLVLRRDPARVGWATAGPLLLAGIGSGIVISPNQTLALTDVPPREGGTAAGVLQTGQRVGSALGISAVGAVFFAELGATHGDWATAISHGLVGSVGFVLLALVVGVIDLVAGAVARRRARRTVVPALAALPPGPTAAAPPSPPSSPSLSSPGTPGVDGRVVRTDGTGIGGAVLTLVDGAGRQGARATSRDDGGFGLDAPAPGVHQLVVRAPGHRPTAAWVRVGDGRARHDLALPDRAEAEVSPASSEVPPASADRVAGRHRAAEPGRPVG